MKKKWILPIILILMLTLAACGAGGDDVDDTPMDPTPDVPDGESPEQETEEPEEPEEDPNTDADQSNDDTASAEAAYEDIKISPEDAFDKFMEAHPDSKVTEVKLDKNFNDYEYKIEGQDNDNDYEVKMDAMSGDIISDDEEILDLDDNDEGEVKKEDVSKVKDLIDKALADAGAEAEVEEWTLDYDDSRLQVEVELREVNNDDVEYTYDLESEDLLEKDI